MPLKVSDGMGAWIDDFKKSDAPQFKGKSEKERREMAIAAYLSAKKGPKDESVRSADKKPEKYMAPDGKVKIRMVPVDKEVIKGSNEMSPAVKAFLAKGGKIKKLPPGKAAGYHGKDDPGKDVKGVMDRPDTDRFTTRRKVKSMESTNEGFYTSNKMDKFVQTPMQNLPNPDTPFGGTTMVGKGFRDLQKAQRRSQASMDARQGGGQSYITKTTPIKRTDFSPNVFPRRSGAKKPRMSAAASRVANKTRVSEAHLTGPLNKKDEPFVKKLISKLRKGSKTHAKQADDLEKAMKTEAKVNELSPATMNRYKKAAGRDQYDASSEIGRIATTPGLGKRFKDKAIGDAEKRREKRVKGLNLATKRSGTPGMQDEKHMVKDKKLKNLMVPNKKDPTAYQKAKEIMKNRQKNEVSADKLSSYMSKASDASKHRGMPTRKVDNRYGGVAMAQDKLAKSGMMGTTAQKVSKAKVPAGKNEAKQTHVFDNEKDARAKAKQIGGKYVKGTGKSAGKHAAIKEETNFEVNIEGLPMMFMSGMSPGEIKAKLRGIVKQPSMINSVKRVTDATVRKTFRLKAQGRDEEEASENYKYDYGTPESVKLMKKITPGQNKDND